MDTTPPLKDGTTLQVTELFVSIQGESTWAGLPCGFVRLTGCNLRCVWCDTPYAYDTGKAMTLDTILDQIRQWRVRLVEITGGEPLLQPAIVSLATILIKEEYTVLIETNGTLPIEVLPAGIIRILDIKCPDSGMHGHMFWPNLDTLTSQDEVKFVLASRKDYDWALEVMHRYTLSDQCHAVLFSPATGLLAPVDLARWMLEDLPIARLQLPLHKTIWPAEQRGV